MWQLRSVSIGTVSVGVPGGLEASDQQSAKASLAFFIRRCQPCRRAFQSDDHLLHSTQVLPLSIFVCRFFRRRTKGQHCSSKPFVRVIFNKMLSSSSNRNGDAHVNVWVQSCRYWVSYVRKNNATPVRSTTRTRLVRAVSTEQEPRAKLSYLVLSFVSSDGWQNRLNFPRTSTLAAS